MLHELTSDWRNRATSADLMGTAGWAWRDYGATLPGVWGLVSLTVLGAETEQWGRAVVTRNINRALLTVIALF